MGSNASGIKRTAIIVRIVAELLSEFVEGFFGRLSYKTCVSECTSIRIGFLFINSSYRFFFPSSLCSEMLGSL